MTYMYSHAISNAFVVILTLQPNATAGLLTRFIYFYTVVVNSNYLNDPRTNTNVLDFPIGF